LKPWWRTQQEANTEVNHQIRALTGRTACNGTTDKVHTLGVHDGVTMGGSTKDELTRLGGGREGGGVSGTGTLDCEESEDETKENSQDGKANVEMVLQAEDDTCGDDNNYQRGSPLPELHLVLLWCWVLHKTIVGLAVGLLLEERAGTAQLGGYSIAANGECFPDTLESGENEAPLHTEFSKGGADHEKDTAARLVSDFLGLRQRGSLTARASSTEGMGCSLGPED
jgi:hypothetical protein